jgi:hypothetical protein
MSRSESQFQPLKDKFQCIAFLEGSYFPSADNLRQGILVLADGIILPAYLDKQAIALRGMGKWKEGEITCFNCYPHSSLQPPYYFLHLNRPSPNCPAATAHVSGVVRQVEEDSYLVLVHRNKKPPSGQEKSPRWKAFPVRVYHSKVNPGWLNHFCYFECRFKQGRLEAIQAEVIRQPLKPKSKSKSKKQDLTPAPVDVASNVVQSTVQKKTTMNTASRLEVTIKMNQIPTPQATKDGTHLFKVQYGDRVVSFSVKQKTWQKVANSAKSMDYFVIAVSGGMGPNTDDGFELLNASAQCFQGKPPKESKEATQNNAQS